jgi:hypothetical protein
VVVSVQTPPQFVSGLQSSVDVDVDDVVVDVDELDDDVELLLDVDDVDEDVELLLDELDVDGTVLVEDELVVVGATPPQLPAVHATPTAQVLPQVPQFAASFCRSVHAPLQTEHAGVQYRSERVARIWWVPNWSVRFNVGWFRAHFIL